MKPRLYQAQVYDDLIGRQILAKGADVNLPGGKGLLRAECVAYQHAELAVYTHDHMRDKTQRIALFLNLEKPKYKNKSSTLGFLSSVKGLQQTEHGSIVIEIRNYLGSHSIFTIYRSTFPHERPTPEVKRFIESVRRDE